MKIARSAASVTLGLGLVLGLGACSSDDSGADPTSASDDSSTSAQEDDAPDDATDDSADAGDSDDADTSDDQTFADSTPENIGASCEEFNTLMAELRLIESSDSEAYEDVYLLAQDARDVAPIETYDLFTALSLMALDASIGEESPETADKLRDAVFASSGPCTAEDVTLTI